MSNVTSPLAFAVALSTPKSMPFALSSCLTGVPGLAFACRAAASRLASSCSVISCASSCEQAIAEERGRGARVERRFAVRIDVEEHARVGESGGRIERHAVTAAARLGADRNRLPTARGSNREAIRPARHQWCVSCRRRRARCTACGTTWRPLRTAARWSSTRRQGPSTPGASRAERPSFRRDRWSAVSWLGRLAAAWPECRAAGGSDDCGRNDILRTVRKSKSYESHQILPQER